MYTSYKISVKLSNYPRKGKQTNEQTNKQTNKQANKEKFPQIPGTSTLNLLAVTQLDCYMIFHGKKFYIQLCTT